MLLSQYLSPISIHVKSTSGNWYKAMIRSLPYYQIVAYQNPIPLLKLFYNPFLNKGNDYSWEISWSFFSKRKITLYQCRYISKADGRAGRWCTYDLWPRLLHWCWLPTPAWVVFQTTSITGVTFLLVPLLVLLWQFAWYVWLSRCRCLISVKVTFCMKRHPGLWYHIRPLTERLDPGSSPSSVFSNGRSFSAKVSDFENDLGKVKFDYKTTYCIISHTRVYRNGNAERKC